MNTNPTPRHKVNMQTIQRLPVDIEHKYSPQKNMFPGSVSPYSDNANRHANRHDKWNPKSDLTRVDSRVQTET